jgi:P27 family predicted phage terminase small subunit
MKPERPPSHLKAPGRRLWRGILRDFDLRDEHDRARLLAACEACGRMTEARTTLDAEGLTFLDRFGQPKPRPELAVERDSRIAMLRALRELGLDAAVAEAARPPELKVYGGAHG